MYSPLTLLSLLLLLACGTPAYEPQGLRKLSHAELLERVKAGGTPSPDVVIREPDGEEIPYDSAVTRYEQAAWTTDAYVNDSAEVVELVLREVGEADLRHREAVKAVYADWNANGRPVELVPVDCAESSTTLESLVRVDQAMRSGSQSVDPTVDREILARVVSLLEQCETASPEGWSAGDWYAAWIIVQHGNLRYQRQYLPLFREVAAAGKLDAGAIALVEDRILVNEGKPQRYGSQVRREDGSTEMTLYELEDPGTVDRRRREVGLEPLAEYLTNFGVTFGVEQVE